MFGQDPKTASGTELESGSTAILRPRRPAAATFRQPTPERPLRVLVTGDSQAEFVGQRLVDVAPRALLRTDVVARNSTGLTRPAFFNWEVNARQEIAARDPDAVVMLMGGNDGFNVVVDGQSYGPFTPEWETEYARRTAVVMRELGERREAAGLLGTLAHGPRRGVQPDLPHPELRRGAGRPRRAGRALRGPLHDDRRRALPGDHADRRPAGDLATGRRRALHARGRAGAGAAGGARDGAGLPGARR